MKLFSPSATFVRESKDVIIQTGASAVKDNPSTLESLHHPFDHSEGDAQLTGNCAPREISGRPKESADHGVKERFGQSEFVH